MMNLRISTTLLSLIASAFGGVATAQTTPNGGAPTTAPAGILSLDGTNRSSAQNCGEDRR